MTHTTDFIAELCRAANEVEKLKPLEKERLLQRALVTIRDMREILDIPPGGTAADTLLLIGSVAASIDRSAGAEVRAALLETAAMIRDLRIAVDSRIEDIVNAARVFRIVH